MAQGKFSITTYGCQMNNHDSERVAGVLESLGYSQSDDARPEEVDVVVFNTCTVREKPDKRLFSQLEQLKAAKRKNPDLVIAVGGCLVEAQRDNIFHDFPHVDVAFGPGRIRDIENFIRLRRGEAARAGVPDEHNGFYGIGDEREFASDLPVRRERDFQAWVQVSMGCNMKCSYCIVPAVRGREMSRPIDAVVAEVERLAVDGVSEVTLLGQNVNSYGRDLPVGKKATFAELLSEVAQIDSIKRVRFTSPHPKDMRDDVIDVMANIEAVCPQLHLPVQSGSSRVLKAMRRTYSRERYLELVRKIREAIPGISLTTDIIVGFPGETEEEFQETFDLCREVRYDGAYTFIYSPRSGTEAAQMVDMPHEIKQERLARLVEEVRTIAHESRQRFVGTEEEVLVEGESRRTPGRLRGRTRHNITVNFEGQALPGDYVPVKIIHASSETMLGRQIPVLA